MNEVPTLLKQVVKWAAGKAGILAMILVGSHARGDAQPDSDLDLVIICNAPNYFLEKTDWTHQFGKPLRQTIEDWGKVTSLRVWYANGLEVEFGITDVGWINEPLDEGTKRVITDGSRVLVDKSNLLSRVSDQ